MRSAVATAQRQSLVNFDYNNSTCLIQIDDGEVRQCLRGPHLTADCAVPRKRHKRLDATPAAAIAVRMSSSRARVANAAAAASWPPAAPLLSRRRN